MAETLSSKPAATPKDERKPLPKLTPSEFRMWNRYAAQMNMLHESFRQTWNLLYTTASTGRRPQNLSIRQFLTLGINYCHSLESHHTFEEHVIFPVLAKRMPRFREAKSDHGEIMRQHQAIEKGHRKLEKWLTECRDGEREVVYGELKEVMDGFGGVLWRHLDDEVVELGAENMRIFWTEEEFKALRI